MASKKRTRIFFVFRMTGDKDIDDFVQVFHKQAIRRVVLRPNRSPFAHVRANILHRGGNHIELLDDITNGSVIKSILALRADINVVVHHLAIDVLLVGSLGEVKIAAVMAKTDVFGINVFPCPILRGQLTIHGVQVRNIIALIVVKSPGEPLPCTHRTHLNRLENHAVEHLNRLMSGNEHPDRLIGKSRDALHFANGVNMVIGRRQIRSEVHAVRIAAIRDAICSIAPSLHIVRTQPLTHRKLLIRSIPNATHNLGKHHGSIKHRRYFLD